MKKGLTGVIILAVLAVIAGWWFFTYGAKKSAPSPAVQKILDVQDERFSKGDPNAPVRIIEYADILCPFCAKAHDATMPQVQAEYIDTGKVYFELRLVGIIAPDSRRAAEGAYCAAEFGKFWEYVDTAYTVTWRDFYSKDKEASDVELFTATNIGNFARSAGFADTLTRLQWQECLNDGKYGDVVAANQDDMRTMEAYGTPHFNINGKNYNGSPPYPVFKATIEAALREKQTESAG